MKKLKKIDLIFKGKLSIDELLCLEDLEPAQFHQDVVQLSMKVLEIHRIFVEYEYQFEKL